MSNGRRFERSASRGILTAVCFVVSSSVVRAAPAATPSDAAVEPASVLSTDEQSASSKQAPLFEQCRFPVRYSAPITAGQDLSHAM
ncbi:MAG TPA: hypothetical protein VIV60_04030, partial [Polyangiaceae bacterium]